eukprot:COSAG03_NODE_8376_length_808_cov_24.356841_2_plen_24_part_01
MHALYDVLSRSSRASEAVAKGAVP